MNTFFEMFQLLEGFGKKRGNSLAALSSDGDDRPWEPAFIPSQQNDGERERAQAGMARNREMDDLVTQAYPSKPAGQKPAGVGDFLQKKPATVNQEVDPEGELPGWARKSNAHVRPADLKRHAPEVADDVLDQRRSAQRHNRLPDSVAQFNQFTSNRGYHDFMVAAMKELGYDVPELDMEYFPQQRVYMGLQPSGRDNEVVVKPDHAQKIMRQVNAKMSSRRGGKGEEKQGFQGNFRDVLAQSNEPAARLALKLDSFFTKDQLRGRGQVVGKPMGPAELAMTLSHLTGKGFEEIGPALKLLHQHAPFLFGKEGDKLVVKQQGNPKDREDQQVFSKTEPITQKSGQSAAVGKTPKGAKPSSAPEGLDKHRGEISQALMGKGNPEKALATVKQLLQTANEKDRAELEGFKKELEGMRECVYWINMSHLVESSTPRF